MFSRPSKEASSTTARLRCRQSRAWYRTSRSWECASTLAGPASNVGMTRQRYTLVGDRYDVLAVDAAETAISSYVLNAPLEVCVPLPPEARHDISDVAIVVSNPDGTLTVLSASVRITASSGVNVCGNLGTLPASIAVGTAGSPEAIPTATPDPDAIEDPDTGGYAPLGSGLLMVLVIFGIGVIFGGLWLMVRGRIVARFRRV